MSKDKEEKPKEIIDTLDLVSGAGVEAWEKQIQEKLGLKILDLQNAICSYIKNHVDDVAIDFPNIAPKGDYGNLLEDNESMCLFLKEECSKAECWLLMGARTSTERSNLIQFLFDCSAVDDGESLKGFVYVSKDGKIRHAFAQNQG